MTTSRLPASDPSSGATLASRIYASLRSDIVRGELAPGSRLAVEHLAKRYGGGPTPVREALNRLVSEGIVTREDQRGFRVSDVSGAEWEELARTRQWVTAVAVQESIAAGEAEWMDALVVAFHRMERLEARLGSARRLLNPEWEAAHRAFHIALIAGCRSRPLIEFYGRLFDAMDRYRHVCAGVPSRRNVLQEHRAIMQAAVTGDAPKALTLLTRHTDLTTKALLEILQSRQQSAGIGQAA